MHGGTPTFRLRIVTQKTTYHSQFDHVVVIDTFNCICKYTWLQFLHPGKILDGCRKNNLVADEMKIYRKTLAIATEKLLRLLGRTIMTFVSHNNTRYTFRVHIHCPPPPPEHVVIPSNSYSTAL